MVEIYNFVRTALLSKDGIEVVLSCGGKGLFEALSSQNASSNQQQPSALSSSSSSGGGDSRRCTLEPSLPSLQITSGVSQIVGALRGLLENAIVLPPDGVAGLPAISAPRQNRDGDEEYEGYVTALLRREQSCLFKALENEALKSSTSRGSLAGRNANRGGGTSSPAALGRTSNRGSASDDETSDRDSGGNVCGPVQHDDSDDSVADDDEAEADNDGNDDGSDGDGSDAEDGNVDIHLELEALEDGSQGVVCDELEVCTDPGAVILSARAKEQLKLSSPKTFAVKGWSTSVEFSQYEDKGFYFQSPTGIKYPKHPSRSTTGFHSTGDDDELSALGKTMPCEPCEVPNPATMNAFIEQATLRRARFLQDDPVTRAKLVYDSKLHYENLANESSSGGPPQSAKPEAYPYFVPEKSGLSQDCDDSLTFDSCFESGNLARAVRIGEWEYDLFLRRDFNTTGHMQWFYFAISNICARGNSPIKYRFNIVNLCKPDSLFNQGLQPVVYSVKDACEKQVTWRRGGTEIYYFSNPFPRSTKRSAKSAASSTEGAAGSASASQPSSVMDTYYTLTFTLEFENIEDTYLVAHSYPYTLSDHLAHLEMISSRLGNASNSILRRSVLCKTLSGKDCELLSISDFNGSTQEQKARRAVVISSRVHPGEAQASWMMQGIIDFLVGDSLVARTLRRIFLFQIIPMLNPDGVYYGNSRCSLAACDLNRVWHTPSQMYHPTIFHAKELLRSEHSTRGLVFFCDLHGHSRKKNVFVYGCDTKKRPNPRARVFAKLFSLQQTAKRYISLPDCSFKISKSKEKTARVVVANEFKLCWCFTLEASFCGGNFGALQGMHYNTQHMQQVGASLCETLFPACVSDGGVREKLSTIIDDYSVNVAAYVDSTLRDGGIVCESSGLIGGARDSGSTTPRKAKAAGNALALRRSSDPASLATKGSYRKTSSSNPPLKQQGSTKIQKQASSREIERKRSQDSRQRSPSVLSTKEAVEIRDASAAVMSPRVYVLSADSDALDCAAPPRAKMSGKKLRIKKKKAKKKPPVHIEDVELTQDGMPMLAACSSSLVHDNAPAASIGRGVSSSSSSSNNGSIRSGLSSLPTKPATCTPASRSPVTTSIRDSTGCLQLTDSIGTLMSKSSVVALPSAFGIDLQSREPASVILPPPIGDLVSRSPKAKASSVRFRYGGDAMQLACVSKCRAANSALLLAFKLAHRGGGRQFAVVNPLRQKNLKDIMVRCMMLDAVRS